MRWGKYRAVVMVGLFACWAASMEGSPHQILVYRKKFVMGTVFEIAAYTPSSEQGSSAIEKAFQQIVRIDDLMSNYKSESALSQLNRSAHFHSEAVPPDLFRVVEQSLQFARLSGGRFDITVGPLVDLWKAALAGDSAPSPTQQQQARACVGYEKIVLTPPDKISFQSPCLQLDLGAIGKGYAVDRAVETLRSLGVDNAFINAGGSTIAALGSPPGQAGWPVYLRDPSHKVRPYVLLRNQSVSTSEQSRPSLLGGNSTGHIIDVATGKPLKTQFVVSVIAPTGTMSDGLSTTLLLLGPVQGKSLVDRIDGASAIWLSQTAQIEMALHGPRILFGEKM